MYLRRPLRLRLAVATAAVLVPTASWGLVPAQATTTTNVNVVGYSVVGPAYKALETAFQATTAGQNVTFTNAFGASDTETSNVVNGQAADLVNLSYGSNMTTLVTANKVPANWASQELTVAGVNVALTGAKQQTVYNTPGIVTDSIVVFVVRSGNPYNYATWASLIKKNAEIVTPNPLTSGSAKWNLLAGYTSQISIGHTPHDAQNFLKSLIERTVAQPTSGSAALAAFVAGTGNVLLDYEDDALAAIAAGDKVQIVTPPQTLLIQNPIALTSTGVANSAAEAFYKYVFSTPGQQILANLGYRSVLKSVWSKTKGKFTTFKKTTDLLTIANISKAGWSVVDPEFFGSDVVFPPNSTAYPSQGIVTYLEKFAGTV